MNCFQTILEADKTKKSFPKTPVSNFILSSEEKAHRWTGLDKYDRETVWQHSGEVKNHLKIINSEPPTTSGWNRVNFWSF